VPRVILDIIQGLLTGLKCSNKAGDRYADRDND